VDGDGPPEEGEDDDVEVRVEVEDVLVWVALEDMLLELTASAHISALTVATTIIF
jgi:hypothetical protein